MALSLATPFAKADNKEINLVFAGNMPDISVDMPVNYPQLANILEKQRAKKLPTLFAFAGGSLGPSPLASLDRGSHIIDILNSLEPDLMTLTKREFSYFEDELTLRTYEAAFPIVTTNLYDPMLNANLEGIASNLMIEKDNIKIGFIAILDEEVVEEYLLQRAKVFEPKQVINRQIALLKQRGAELVVLVYSKQRDYYQTLIEQTKIDFALRVSPTDDLTANSKVTNKVYSISNSQPLKILNVRWQNDGPNKNLQITTQPIVLDESAMPSETTLLIDEYQQRLNRLLAQKIGMFGNDIQTSRKLIRTQEMPFGNFVADVIRQFTNAEIGLVNGGVIRGNKSYAKGDVITRRDIVSELPFRTHLTLVNVSGMQLKQVLENAVSGVETAKGRFLQVSGLSYRFSTKQPVGQRTSEIKVNGQNIDLNAVYSVATTDYLAAGGDGYDAFLLAKTVDNDQQPSPLLSDLIIRAIQQQKTLSTKSEGRIRRLEK
jgi:2',3'-cyclic-nucleotide 2'-phosphodiesterase (5'-nucleotidase family)